MYFRKLNSRLIERGDDSEKRSLAIKKKNAIFWEFSQPEFHPITSSRYYSLSNSCWEEKLHDSKQSDEFQARIFVNFRGFFGEF